MTKKIKNLSELHELIKSLGKRTSLAKDQVMFALELALEQSVCEYFNLSDCQIDVENKIVMPSSFKEDMIGLRDHGEESIALGFAFEMLNKDIIDRCRLLFNRNLNQMEKAYLYEKWKRKVHHVVKGVVYDADSAKVMIHLGDNLRGIMTRPEWVPTENLSYQAGVVMWFYVSKVLQDKSDVVVYLSRGSKNLPSALLREKLPWINIKAIKRFRGVKTYLKSNAAIDSNIIKEVQRELKGEMVDIQVI